MQSVTKKRIGILRGGKGENYATSLKKGGEIILNINENLGDKYKTFDILIDRKGIWHFNGMPIKPSELVNKVDVVWNIARPQSTIVLESFSIPCINNGAFAWAMENNRDMLRDHMKNIGVPMPRSVSSPSSAREVFQKLGAPWRAGEKLIKTFPELVELIENNKNILIEEYIEGSNTSIHSVPDFRGQDIYIFPARNATHSVAGGPPSNLTHQDKDKLYVLVKELHHRLGINYYLKSDFIVNPKGKIYLLGIESNPDLKQDSHFSQACESVGAKTRNVIEHILENAI